MNSKNTLLVFTFTIALSTSCISAYASDTGDKHGYSQPMGGSYDNNTNQGGAYHVPYPPNNNQTVQYPPPPSSGKGCDQPEISQAQTELATAEQNYQNLKSNYYQNWQQLSSSGKYNGTWDEYAKENLLNSTEVGKIRQIHEQYGGFVQYCYPTPQGGRSTPIVLPVTNGETVGGTVTGTANGTTTVVPQSSKTTDVLMEIEPPASIPMWIKNSAKWWSQGQISDSDFTSGIQYLASNKIIQLYSSPSSANNTVSSLPQWVKGLAGSWADGTVSNDYFVTSIQYLADQNIIKMP